MTTPTVKETNTALEVLQGEKTYTRNEIERLDQNILDLKNQLSVLEDERDLHQQRYTDLSEAITDLRERDLIKG